MYYVRKITIISAFFIVVVVFRVESAEPEFDTFVGQDIEKSRLQTAGMAICSLKIFFGECSISAEDKPYSFSFAGTL